MGPWLAYYLSIYLPSNVIIERERERVRKKKRKKKIKKKIKKKRKGGVRETR